eukprot:CCRYP_001783-RA/>CCRYP_001783-RA protein AED:0.25 eAED:0.25 QI:0/0/0/1/1/1/2/0/207
MDVDAFVKLHRELYDRLNEHFPTKRRRGHTPNGVIETKLCLSAAIRYYAGGSPLDIMLSHGMSRSAVYDSVWGTVDVVNKTSSMAFNDDSAHFPSHEEQTEITKGFVAMSAAGFDNICLAVDGIHPGVTSDYLAFASSELALKLEMPNNNILKSGNTMVGENAWVETPWMATPIPGLNISPTDDAYNFYHSQIRITIERAFVILVHR